MIGILPKKNIQLRFFAFQKSRSKPIFFKWILMYWNQYGGPFSKYLNVSFRNQNKKQTAQNKINVLKQKKVNENLAEF